METASQWSSAWMLFAPMGRGETPVGVIFGNMRSHALEPHVIWFPWASPRAKLETIAGFVHDMNDHFVVMIFAMQSDTKIYDRLVKYKVLKRLGSVPGLYGEEDGVIYHGVSA